MKRQNFKRTDTRPKIEYNPYEDNRPVSLPSGVTATFRLVDEHDNVALVQSASATVESNDPATLSYTFAAGETDVAGDYEGEFFNCTAGFDYNNTGLANADTSGHATQGFATEDKGHGSNVHLTQCTVKMINVANSGGGADVRSGSFGRVEDCDFHTYNGAGAPDIVIDGSCDAIAHCTFEGTEDSGVCVENNGPPVNVRDNSFDYPGSRSNYSGPIS